MRIDPIQLETQNKLILDYRNNKKEIMDYFDYGLSTLDFEKRVNDLRKRHFKRDKLSIVLHRLNKHWNAPKATLDNIERLKDDKSVVAIGGQQAGLLTGPMYTINKIISIIQFAKEKEAELKIPVIPVFWIAGEDHDFDEINHVFLPEIKQMKKQKIKHHVFNKMPLSDIEVNEKEANEWLDGLFVQLEESQHTKGIYETLQDCLEKSTTYVDFFARVVFQLFDEEGLVLIDSGNPELRKLESDYFIKLIEKQDEIGKGVYSTLKQLTQADYSISLEAELRDGHLFYHKNNERIMLVRNETGDWIGKQNEIKLTTAELIAIAKNEPELLSNNVVTRPVMQELLFPSLAFIGGNGEISYWSALKPAFKAVDISMPPVLPRLSFTYVDLKIEKLLKKHSISAKEAILSGVELQKTKWLDIKSKLPVQKVASQLKEIIEKEHEPIRNMARELGPDLGNLAEKNLFYLHRDVEYIENRIIKAIETKYKKEIQEFDTLANALHPKGVLQERVWNPLPWINENGTDFIKRLTAQSCSFENEHYIAYI